MSGQDVMLIEVGQPAWPRWMIFHRDKCRYWSKGVWKKRRRNGALWASKSEAGKELTVARASAQGS
jgi:hypothetical protein